MNDQLNPYIAGAPITETAMFFGREDVFDWIKRNLRGQYVDHILVLHGQRRIGKTSVLKQLPNQLSKRYIPIFLDLQGRSQISFDRFQWWMARETTRALKQIHDISVSLPDLDLFTNDSDYFENNFLLNIRNVLPDKVLLYTIDEFDVIEDSEKEGLNKQLCEFLKRLIGKDGLTFIFSIGSSGRKLEIMRSAYTELFKSALYKKISFLRKDDAFRLITEPANEILRYSQEALDRIYQISSGYPYYTQLICHELFSCYQKTGVSQITAREVDAVLEDVVERGTVNLKFVWDEASPIEKWALAGLAQLYSEPNQNNLFNYLKDRDVILNHKILESTLLHLHEHDVLTKENQFQILLMKIWLQKNRPIERVREEMAGVDLSVYQFNGVGIEYEKIGSQIKANGNDHEAAIARVLQTFLTHSRRLALANHTDLPEQSIGTCLFADISGFTPLTESLGSSHGPQKGAEIVAEIINTIMTDLVEQIHEYGGDVTSFAGDSLTSLFPSPSITQAQVIACALDMQEALAQHKFNSLPKNIRPQLNLNIGIASGMIRRLLVGDPEYAVFDLLSGAPLERMATAAHYAKGGEIVCAHEVAKSLGTEVVWGDERSGYQVLKKLNYSIVKPALQHLPSDLPLSTLKPFFPKSVFTWLSGSGGHFQAELRPAVSAFVCFSGLDFENDPHVGEKLHRYLCLVQRITEQYGGTLNLLDYGDKGSIFHVLFGAPFAHTDNEIRAIGWALELQSKLRQNQDVRWLTTQSIGISRGQMYAGMVGSETRRGYSVIGDDVNASARLMQACQPWQILVSSPVMKVAQKRYAFHQFPGFQVKGKSGPIPVAMPIAPLPHSPAQWFNTKLVGRQFEMACLEAALKELLDNRSRVVSIEGAEGIGKSRLVGEVEQRALSLGIRVLVGYAQSTGQNTPYDAWREIVRSLFGLQYSWPAQQQAMQIQTMMQWINPKHLSSIPLLGDLLGISITETSLTRTISSQERQQHLFALIGDLLSGFASQQPILTIIEDCQWLDQASTALIESVIKRLARERFFILITYRSELKSDNPLLYRVRGLPHSIIMSLDELYPQEIQAMLTELLGGDLSSESLALIQERTQGNPLFIEEMAQALRETNWLQLRNNRWVLVGDTLPTLQLPDTIRGIVLARLDTLDEQLKLTLRVASVIGQRFDISQLLQIHPGKLTRSELEDQLSALENQNLLISNIVENQRVYQFRHTVIHEVAYGTLLYAQRQELHLALAVWIERSHEKELNAFYPLLAHHYTEANIFSQALEYYILAGDSARWLYAQQEAIQHYRKALGLLEMEGPESFERQARILMRLGLTHLNAFDYAAARQCYEDGFRIWQRAFEVLPATTLVPASKPLRVDLPYMPLSLDPMQSSDVDTMSVVSQLFSGLVEMGPGMEILPDIALRWEISDDGRRYIFHLRKDVTWSDGHPVTASDFEFAWRRTLHPVNDSPSAHLLYDIRGAKAYHSGLVYDPASVGITVIDDATLEVILEQPTSYFLYILALNISLPVPCHKIQQYSEAWTKPENLVTNGPFRLITWGMHDEQDGKLILERSSTYHGQFIGNISRVECFSLPTSAARLEAYESGNLDVLSFRNFSQEQERMRQEHAEEYLSAPQLSTMFISFNVCQSPFQDHRVRRALGMAVDREEFANQIAKGFSFPGTGGLLPPGMPGYTPNSGLPFDPVCARLLFAEAGYLNGKGFPEVEFLVNDDSQGQAGFIARQWQQNLGIKINPHIVDWENFSARLENNPPHIFIDISVCDYPDPDNFLRASPVLGWSRWQDNIYQSLVETARKTQDQAERIDIYRSAEKRMIEAAVVIPFKYLRSHFLIHPSVERYPTSPMAWWYWKDVILKS